MRRSWALLLWAWALALVAASPTGPATTSTEQDLLDWVAARGGTVHLRVGRACTTCPRGALASKALLAGDVLVRVPINCTIALYGETMPKSAMELLGRMHADPTFNQTFGPWLAALPGPGDVLTPVVYTSAYMDMLQSSELAERAKKIISKAEAVYYGNAANYCARSNAMHERGLSLEQFKHYVALVTSRSFNLLNATLIVPAIEMLNHDDQPNANFPEVEGDFVVLRAKLPVAKHEPFTIRYHTALHRPDASLFGYGFVQDAAEPLLCASDLPDLPALYNTPRNDEDHDPYKRGRHASRAEYERLNKLLLGMPTTLEEDMALLAGSELTDWRARTLVQFRALRKLALQHVVDRMKLWLDKAVAEAVVE